MIEWLLMLLLSLWSDTTVINEGVATTTAQVIHVIDGDTIDVRIAEEVMRVRYIGIDTPEPYAGTAPECFAADASAANRSLVAGQTVALVADQEDRDTYNRLLRYVYVDDVLVNAELLRGGFATTLTIPPNTRFARQFAELQATAQNQSRGLWAACE